MTAETRQPAPWQPSRLVRVEKSFDTSMGTTRIKTDASSAYIKTMGNRQGPHALASEFVASSLAKWFGLAVPDFAIMDLPEESCFELPRGVLTEAGPAFVSRHVQGRTWQGSVDELRRVPLAARPPVFSAAAGAPPPHPRPIPPSPPEGAPGATGGSPASVLRSRWGSAPAPPSEPPLSA